MAKGKRTLTVSLSYAAADELDAIWRYNAKRRGMARANHWDSFLKQRIVNLASEYDDGDTFERFPELRYVLCRNRPRDDGHYLIYEVDETAQTVTILHIFHTKMDVIGRLADEY